MFYLISFKIISKNFSEISSSVRIVHTEICLGYTKFYVAEK